MLDMHNTDLIPLSRALIHLPHTSEGKTISRTTLHRWATQGLRGRLKIETVQIGGRRYTSLTAIQAFLTECQYR